MYAESQLISMEQSIISYGHFLASSSVDDNIMQFNIFSMQVAVAGVVSKN